MEKIIEIKKGVDGALSDGSFKLEIKDGTEKGCSEIVMIIVTKNVPDVFLEETASAIGMNFGVQGLEDLELEIIQDLKMRRNGEGLSEVQRMKNV